MRANSRFENGRWVHDAATGAELERWADRLQSAHEAEFETACRDASRWESRADRAAGLLRECQPYVSSMAQASHLTDGFSRKPPNEHDELAARLTAFLSEQAGERENGK